MTEEAVFITGRFIRRDFKEECYTEYIRQFKIERGSARGGCRSGESVDKITWFFFVEFHVKL